MRQQIRALATFTFLLSLAGAGCDDDSPPPTMPSDTSPPVVESFVGTLAVNGVGFYSFTVPNEGPVALTLLELTENGQPTSAVVGLGIGSPLGVGCTASVSVSTGPGSTPQLRQSLTPGIYCAQVTDVGQLTTAANFALNIQRPR